MIVFLTGVLRHKEAASCTIDCAGVGYGVEMSTHALAKLAAVGERCEAHIYTHVAEDQLRLFGFVDASEKQAFVALLSANGVGPKLAMTILSTLSTAELYQAALAREASALVRVPGIGKKKAERLILDLEGRLAERIGASLAAAGHAAPGTAAAPAQSRGVGPVADAVSALVHLGFAEQAAHRACTAAHERMATAADGSSKRGAPDVAELVRVALQSLTPR